MSFRRGDVLANLADFFHEPSVLFEVRFVSRISVKAHDELLGEKVHVGKLDELFEDVTRRRKSPPVASD